MTVPTTTRTLYTQLQPEDRLTLASMYQQGRSMGAIARVIGCSPATISRELRRNACDAGCYASVPAQTRCRQRRRRRSPCMQARSQGAVVRRGAPLLAFARVAPADCADTGVPLITQWPPLARVARVPLQLHLRHARGRAAPRAHRLSASSAQQAHATQQGAGSARPAPRHAQHPCAPGRG
jgi:hypothetical protein